jgi:hypothetical protein
MWIHTACIRCNTNLLSHHLNKSKQVHSRPELLHMKYIQICITWSTVSLHIFLFCTTNENAKNSEFVTFLYRNRGVTFPEISDEVQIQQYLNGGFSTYVTANWNSPKNLQWYPHNNSLHLFHDLREVNEHVFIYACCRLFKAGVLNIFPDSGPYSPILIDLCEPQTYKEGHFNEISQILKCY